MTSINGLKVGFWGFPAFYGDQAYKDAFNGFDLISASGKGTLDQGYYFEFFTELAMNQANLIPENVEGDFKLFAKFIVMSGRGNANITFNDTGSGTTTEASLDSS